jgi:acyl-CoA synthetase (AMP-forming)/AMP-acid ligase II
MNASAGAAPIDAALQAAAGKKVGAGHVNQTWGLSETTGAVTAMSRGGEPDFTGSISPLLPNVELRFVDENDNVRGPPFLFCFNADQCGVGRARRPARRDPRARAYRDQGLPQQPRGHQGGLSQRLVRHGRHCRRAGREVLHRRPPQGLSPTHVIFLANR